MFEIFEGVLNSYTGNEEYIVIPQEITSIGEFAFYNNTSIKKVILHDKITSIGQFAFYGCENLETMMIPESCTLIGAGAFSCCYALKEIQLPSLLRTLNKSTFYRCYGLKEVTLPDWVTVIDRGAFEGCKNLERVKLPAQLKTIGATAFCDCVKLKNVELPERLYKIGDKAFLRCHSLKELVLPSSMQEVGMAAFQTYGKLRFIGNDTLLLKPKMFDEHYMFDVVQKNAGNYQFENSYFPCVNFNEWKYVGKINLLVNYLESYDLYDENHFYKTKLIEMKDAVISHLVQEKRFACLNKGIDEGLFKTIDIDPYFEKIMDREQKAKLLDYRNKELQSSNTFDDLDDLLDDLF